MCPIKPTKNNEKKKKYNGLFDINLRRKLFTNVNPKDRVIWSLFIHPCSFVRFLFGPFDPDWYRNL